jgi:hypothetical protein
MLSKLAYLQAEGDAAAATELFRNTLAYRKEHVCGREETWSATHKSIVGERRGWKRHIVAVTPDGSPIVMGRLLYANPEVMLELKEQETKDFYIGEVELLLRLQVEHRTGDVLPGCIEIWDANGFQSGWMASTALYSIVDTFLSSSKNYPGMLRKAFFCNLPSFAIPLVNMAKMIQSAEQADKMCVLDGIPTEEMEKIMGKEVVARVVEVMKHDEAVGNEAAA